MGYNKIRTKPLKSSQIKAKPPKPASSMVTPIKLRTKEKV